MRIAVLANPESWYLADLQRAAHDAGHELFRVDYRRLVGRVDRVEIDGDPPISLSNVDAVIVRTMPPGSLEQVVFRMDALLHLEESGVAVVNPPKAIECAVDKFLATSRLARADLPVPPTIVCENFESAMSAFEELSRDVVVKPIFGSEGRGIVRVTDPEMAHRVFRTLERIDAVLYLQQFVPHAGFDVRVLVLDGQVVGGIRRRANGDFRTNVAQHGTVEPHRPTPIERQLALDSTHAIGARISGVDLLQDRRDGTHYVIEVNAVPGWKAFERATKIDVAARLIESLSR
ncbi:MAG: RimK family alpha-L-glutamate ligase [Planctomycetota bacterium]|nr:RimK family alpha-L-glutamate ligase [Planctomycetota bacterium]